MFYENLETILKQRKISINQFAKEIGIKQQTISNWKNRSVPSADYIKRIAEYLKVSSDYLLDIEIQSNSENLNAQERILISYYRAADERGKKTILSMAKQETELIKKKETSYHSEAI